MADAFIYDAIRTPRGRGKADGSLHEVTALELATQALGAIKARSNLDPAMVDDVVLGCDGQLRMTHRSAGLAQLLEGWSAGRLLQHMPADEDEIAAVIERLDEVGGPDLLEDAARDMRGRRLAHGPPSLLPAIERTSGVGW